MMPRLAADTETILRRAGAFPGYTIRPIRRNPPTDGSTNDPAIFANSATGKLTEVGEVQWYLKAMFQRRCEEEREQGRPAARRAVPI